MEFEWDEAKNYRNVSKHGLSFEEAATVFEGRYLVAESLQPRIGEVRFVAYGQLAGSGVIATVVYTVRKGKVRIISARTASRMERSEFYEAFEEKN